MSIFSVHSDLAIAVKDSGDGLFEVTVSVSEAEGDSSFVDLTRKYEMLIKGAPTQSDTQSNVTYQIVPSALAGNAPSIQWVSRGSGVVIAEDVCYIWGREGERLDTLPPSNLPSFPLPGSRNTISHLIKKQSGSTADRYYGLGEVSGSLNHNGRSYLLRPSDSMGYDAELADPLYKHIPFTVAYSPTSGEYYGVYYCCGGGATCEVDYGHSLNNYLGSFWRTTIDLPQMPNEGSKGKAQLLRYYFIHGPTMASVVSKFTKRLVGTTAPAPLWALGYLGSAMGYTDAPDAQAALIDGYLAKCQQHKIITSGFHLSSGYCMSKEGLRYVFHWNNERVPEPEKLSATFRKAHVRLIANIKPAMLESHPLYKEVCAKGLFISQGPQPSTGPLLTLFWGGSASYLDFTNPATVGWWKDQVKNSILANGITSTWNDNNEYVGVEGYCFGGVPTAAVRQLQSLLMTRASIEAQAEYTSVAAVTQSSPAVEGINYPFAITRCGVSGHSRIASTWSGDNYTSWKTLKYNIFMGLGLSLSGWGNIGHDVGGFSGPQPSAELLFRWVQQGIFMPRFTIHSWKLDKPETSPWMFGDFWTNVFRSLIALRDVLTPTIFSMLVASNITGAPILRPRIYHEEPSLVLTDAVEDEGHPSHLDEDTSYYFGSADIVVYPCVEYGKTSVKVRLPPTETGWWLLDGSNRTYEGGFDSEISCKLPSPTKIALAPDYWPIVFFRCGTSIVLKKTQRNKGVFSVFSECGVPMRSLGDTLPPVAASSDGASEPYELFLFTVPSSQADKQSNRSQQLYLPINDHTTQFVTLNV